MLNVDRRGATKQLGLRGVNYWNDKSERLRTRFILKHTLDKHQPTSA